MLKNLAILVVWAAAAQLGRATVLTEDFNAVFPAWESGWFGSNSNAQNYYGVGQGRGNNPDGLWIDDSTPGDGDIRVVFNNPFAVSLTSLFFDVAGFSATRLQFFDASGAVLSDAQITLTSGAFSNPGVYVNYGVVSGTGIGGFEFYTGSPEGNTSIDNIVANGSALTQAPEPATWILVLPMLLIAALSSRKLNRSFR